jgi:hypothetical protein
VSTSKDGEGIDPDQLAWAADLKRYFELTQRWRDLHLPREIERAAKVGAVNRHDLEKSHAARQAMVNNQADPPPMIIHILRVLLDPKSYPPGHAKWVEDGARAILKNWEHAEDPFQLKLDLGLTGPKRSKERTMRRETTIAAAVANAALAGAEDPRRVAREELKVTAHDVRTVWKTWATVYIEQLRLMISRAPAEERPTIQRAILVLEKLSKDKK